MDRARYRYREAVVFTPKERRTAFTPPIEVGESVTGRFQCRVGKRIWVNLDDYGGRFAFAIATCDEDECMLASSKDAPVIVELGTIKSVGPLHLEVTGVHSDEAMAALHEELTGRAVPEDAGRLALPPGSETKEP